MRVAPSSRDQDESSIAESTPVGTPVKPRLAVLIPIFNHQEGLERSLASLAQDGSKFDAFVVDDGSAVPVRIPSGLPYQVRLLRHDPNRGITGALNAGLALIAEGGYQYLARLDACDLTLPGRFAAQMAFLDSHPDHAVVGTAARYVDMRGNLLFEYRPPTGHDALTRFLRYRAGIVHPSAMIRVRALIECGPYRDDFPGAEDHDLFMRLAKAHKVANLDPIFVVKEVSPDSITSNRKMILASRLRILLCHFDPRSIHSYAGVTTNTLLWLAPRPLILKLRQLFERWRTRISRGS